MFLPALNNWILIFLPNVLGNIVQAQGGRPQTAVFKSWPRFLIGLRSGFWLGYSNACRFLILNHSIVALAICFSYLSSWRVNIHFSLKSLVDWNKFCLLGLPCIDLSNQCCPQSWPVSQSLVMESIFTTRCYHHHALLAPFVALCANAFFLFIYFCLRKQRTFSIFWLSHEPTWAFLYWLSSHPALWSVHSMVVL